MADLRKIREEYQKKGLTSSKVSKVEALASIQNLNKILASTGAIKRGVIKFKTGKKSSEQAVDKEVPAGYIAVFNNNDKSTDGIRIARMPFASFERLLKLFESDIGKKTADGMLKKAQSKDREIYSKNKTLLKILKIDKDVINTALPPAKPKPVPKVKPISDPKPAVPKVIKIDTPEKLPDLSFNRPPQQRLDTGRTTGFTDVNFLPDLIKSIIKEVKKQEKQLSEDELMNIGRKVGWKYWLENGETLGDSIVTQEKYQLKNKYENESDYMLINIDFNNSDIDMGEGQLLKYPDGRMESDPDDPHRPQGKYASNITSLWGSSAFTSKSRGDGMIYAVPGKHNGATGWFLNKEEQMSKKTIKSFKGDPDKFYLSDGHEVAFMSREQGENIMMKEYIDDDDGWRTFDIHISNLTLLADFWKYAEQHAVNDGEDWGEEKEIDFLEVDEEGEVLGYGDDDDDDDDDEGDGYSDDDDDDGEFAEYEVKPPPSNTNILLSFKQWLDEGEGSLKTPDLETKRISAEKTAEKHIEMQKKIDAKLKAGKKLTKEESKFEPFDDQMEDYLEGLGEQDKKRNIAIKYNESITKKDKMMKRLKPKSFKVNLVFVNNTPRFKEADQTVYPKSLEGTDFMMSNGASRKDFDEKSFQEHWEEYRVYCEKYAKTRGTYARECRFEYDDDEKMYLLNAVDDDLDDTYVGKTKNPFKFINRVFNERIDIDVDEEEIEEQIRTAMVTFLATDLDWISDFDLVFHNSWGNGLLMDADDEDDDELPDDSDIDEDDI